jgi:hypothetical protein
MFDLGKTYNKAMFRIRERISTLIVAQARKIYWGSKECGLEAEPPHGHLASSGSNRLALYSRTRYLLQIRWDMKAGPISLLKMITLLGVVVSSTFLSILMSVTIA